MQEENTGIEKDLYWSSVTGSGEIRFHPKTPVPLTGLHRVGTVVASYLWMTKKCKQKLMAKLTTYWNILDTVDRISYK